MSRCWPVLFLAAVGLLVGPESGTAQLLSPGKLAAPHSDLAGMRNCTNCHVLGERGISNRLCLECHEPIRNRLAQRRGFHATVAEQQCSECHKDHFGEDFQLVRFDTDSFVHSTVGFDLVETHGDLNCVDCHQPELITAEDVRAFNGEHGTMDKTFLGLGTTCFACHTSDDPHGLQFAERPCIECHGQTTWNELIGFDHNRTRYRLTGLHRRQTCASCHPTTTSTPGVPQVKYTNLRFSRCTSCHQDIHRGAMGENCTSCHNTAGWSDLDRVALENRFDHEITGYSLVDAHGTLSCSDCHDPTHANRDGLQLTYPDGSLEDAYPAPFAETCVSCHLDYHDGVFQESQGGIECEICHSQTEWLPANYDITRHNREARFELLGAHVVIPCQSCHNSSSAEAAPPRFRFESDECSYCHQADDPHSSQFVGMRCTECHDTESFAIESFDHSATNYPLDGAHREVACIDCHRLATDAGGLTYRVYKPLGMACIDCHGGST
jgi:hypothetical protein